MNRVIKYLCSIIMSFAILLPMTAYAAGDPNIGGGGGGLGDGSSQYYWNETYDGVRMTLIRSDTGAVVSQSIDATNRDTSIIQAHFGLNSKRAYNSGLSLTPSTSTYVAHNPAVALPKIVNSAAYPADINRIRAYFCDEDILRWFAAEIGFDFDTMIGGDYKLMIEPVVYVVYSGIWFAMTATEAALYNQQTGGMLRSWLGGVTHKNLPLAIYLERDEMGYSAWTGGNNVFVNDPIIISTLGVGLVRFTDVDEYVGGEDGGPDYTYRTDTDVITSVYVSGGYANPNAPVTVTFNIRGTNYNVNNVYYPEDGTQLVWVRWHTPNSPMQITISVSAGGRTVSDSSIVCNIVDLVENPPPNPVADDRNDSYNSSLAVMPSNPELTSTSWSVWRCTWHPNWEWVADWRWETVQVWHQNLVWIPFSHSPYCPRNCTTNHGYWRDDGWYEDEVRWYDEGRWEDHGWWVYYQDTYWANLSASTSVVPDSLDPTAYGDTIKSGYGVNQILTASATSNDYGSITGAQNAQSWFPEFYYQSYWRNLERTTSGYNTTLQFKPNPYSTYNNRTHFTPVWMKNGDYRVYTYLFDMWTPNGMLSMNLYDGVTINGSLWDDWHIAPENPD